VLAVLAGEARRADALVVLQIRQTHILYYIT
jgi:hypothetical protein